MAAPPTGSAVYEHTQHGSALLLAVGGAGVVLLALAALLTRTATPAWPVLLVTGVVLVVVAWLFSTMTVTVSAAAVSLRMARGLVRRDWPLAQVKSAQVVRTRWHNGWGIHGWGHNWLYNVSGFGAVRMDLADGAHVSIGSDEPERLLQAIVAARGAR